MSDSSRMALVLVSDAEDRLEEAAAFVASGAAMGFAVRLLVTGPALTRWLSGRVPESVAARLADARDVGDVRLYACAAVLARAGRTPDDALGAGPLPFDEVLGIPAFLPHLAGADVQLVF